MFELLKTSERLLLDALKTQTAFSNKKWDKAIKGLTSKKVAKVVKEGEELFVELANLTNLKISKLYTLSESKDSDKVFLLTINL